MARAGLSISTVGGTHMMSSATAFMRSSPSVTTAITVNTDFGETEVDDRQVRRQVAGQGRRLAVRQCQHHEVGLGQNVGQGADLGLALAKTGHASIEQLTPDATDVEKIARRARSLETTTGMENENRRPEDAGYFLLPLLALLALFWSRRGWIVR